MAETASIVEPGLRTLKSVRLPSDSCEAEVYTKKRYTLSETYGIILGRAITCSGVQVDMERVNLVMARFHPDAPSVIKSVMLLQALFPAAVGRQPILVLTYEVKTLVDLLRAYFPSKMVGSSCEDEWMGRVLDLIVASPHDVMQYDHGRYVCAMVVAAELSQETKEAINRIESSVKFSSMVDADGHVQMTLFPSTYGSLHEFSPCLPISSDVLLKLPEAGSCWGLGDGAFLQLVTEYALGGVSVSTVDWSGIIALLPGLVRGIDMLSTPASLVLVPSNRVISTFELLQAFLRHMGMDHVAVSIAQSGMRNEGHILIGTPEEACKCTMDALKKVVVLEINMLLDAGLKPQIESILSKTTGAQLAVHFSSPSEEGEKIFRVFCGSQRIYCLESAKVTMERVRLLVQHVSSEEEKLNKLCDIYKHFGTSMKLVVVCNSREKVEEVAEAVRSRGVRVLTIHTGMDLEEVTKARQDAEKRPCLVVSNVMDRQMQRAHIVMYEMPGDSSEYVQRCGVGRRTSCRVVVNFDSGEDELRILKDFKPEVQPEPIDLPPKLTRRFFKHAATRWICFAPKQRA